ncbi:hypothetical protein QTP88_029567 [Uroleucon formosanum]
MSSLEPDAATRTEAPDIFSASVFFRRVTAALDLPPLPKSKTTSAPLVFLMPVTVAPKPSGFTPDLWMIPTVFSKVISSYFQFSDPTRTSVDALESILESLSGGVLVYADVNARSALWHDCKPDARGEIVVDFISRKDLKVHNVAGFPPTFKNRGSACLDVTLTRINVRVTDWSVSHDPTSSDHALISFGIVAKNDVRVGVQDTVIKYNWRRTDWVQFRKTLETYRDARNSDLVCPSVETSSRGLTEVLTQACEKYTKASGKRKHKPPPWWNSMLDRELSSLGHWKAKLRNARTAIAKRAIRKVLSKRKVARKRHCFKARRKAWRKFVTDAGNKNPWGLVFKWLKKGGTRPLKDIPAAL